MIGVDVDQSVESRDSHHFRNEESWGFYLRCTGRLLSASRGKTVTLDASQDECKTSNGNF